MMSPKASLLTEPWPQLSEGVIPLPSLRQKDSMETSQELTQAPNSLASRTLTATQCPALGLRCRREKPVLCWVPGGAKPHSRPGNLQRGLSDGSRSPAP